ncbi:hypothetical protein BC659_3259 [Sediminibacterium goheungense]|uniref:Uncharacterized protein n=1 Tax=Sediminibacterium goheungense TaxID=1086393 RepID=A0A4R6INZ7_9BACT|nr:hypothetical protein BC659_3259 [Sediminibacterium goheungense]
MFPLLIDYDSDNKTDKRNVLSHLQYAIHITQINKSHASCVRVMSTAYILKTYTVSGIQAQGYIKTKENLFLFYKLVKKML